MMPIIGPAPKHRGLWVAIGHAHHGFTLGPATGHLLAQTMTGEKPAIDITPFGMERFIDFIVRQKADGMAAAETLRRLIKSIMEYQRGQLQDDATVITVEWRSGRRAGVTL